jgi:putative hydrolase of the HAD superfamily
MLLTDFDALTFDCYGTLIDWESGMIAALKGLTDRAQRPLTRDLILQAHARQESSQQRYTPTKRYSDLLAVVYKRLAEEWGVHATHEECAAYGRSIGDWPAFEDSAQALAYLKHHFKLVILSNVDNESFRISNQKLGVVFDAIYTAEDIGSYKPSAQNFDYMIEKLDACGVKKAENPAHGREHVSRSQARERSRIEVVLDLPAAREAGFWRDHGPRPETACRFYLPQHARVRAGPSAAAWNELKLPLLTAMPCAVG